MSGFVYLHVGPHEVYELFDSIENELLAVFRDDMLVKSIGSVKERYGDDYQTSADRPEMLEVFEFRASGYAIAQRLDCMGVDGATALARMDEQVGKNARMYSLEGIDNEQRARIEASSKFMRALTPDRWLEFFAKSVPSEPQNYLKDPESSESMLFELRNWDHRLALRLVLLALPDAEVVLDITDIKDDVSRLREDEAAVLASNAAQAIRATGMHAPAVVLTEGRTDAEFLSAGLQVLYPHLTDLIRFLDYERKPEGGVSALVRMVRAFAAAGIVNRIVAVFDNDTAAADGLRVLDQARLPPQIQIIRYPDLALARQYPTLGPPTAEASTGSVNLADINGLACSIELYLGKDILSRPDGSFYPVQWKSFMPGINRYQGEVIGKADIHDAFRAKYARALGKPSTSQDEDWEGIRLILDAIRDAALAAFDGAEGSGGHPSRLIH
jgi:hypothetical protein